MNIEIKLNLKPILIQKGISQKELAQMTGLREAGISEMVNNRRDNINKEHLALIMKTLKIYDIKEIIKVITY